MRWVAICLSVGQILDQMLQRVDTLYALEIIHRHATGIWAFLFLG